MKKKTEHKMYYTPKISDHSIITINFPLVQNSIEKIVNRNMGKCNEIQFQ